MRTLTLDEAASVLKTNDEYWHARDVADWARKYYPDDTVMVSFLIGLAREARKRSGRSGLPCNVTAANVVAMYYNGEARCALSGVPFSLTPFGMSTRRPWAPSLDRIDSSKGYTKKNARLVCCAVNYLMNEWGDEVFHTLATKIREARC